MVFLGVVFQLPWISSVAHPIFAGYPRPGYSNELDCQWFIEAEDSGALLEFTVKRMRMEQNCEFDRLEFYAGEALKVSLVLNLITLPCFFISLRTSWLQGGALLSFRHSIRGHLGWFAVWNQRGLHVADSELKCCHAFADGQKVHRRRICTHCAPR